jgi:hypothetical protein
VLLPRRRRVSVGRETDQDIVEAAVPDGYEVAPSRARWLAHAHATIDADTRFRSDRKLTLTTTADTFLWRADTASMTSRPGRTCIGRRLDQVTGHGSDRTVDYAIATLVDDLHLVARVAGARRGCHCPGGCRSREKKSGPCLTPGRCPDNEVPVFVLIVPLRHKRRRAEQQNVEQPAVEAVDELCAAPQLVWEEENNLNAREPTEPRTEPLRGTEPLAAPAAPHPSGAPSRQLPAQPGQATARRKDHRRALAAQVVSRVGVLADAVKARRLSLAAVAAILLPYLLAGWTVDDIVHAIDHRPDGTPQPPPGPGTDWRRGWLHNRLATWTVDDTVTRSHSQRRDAERQRDAARTRAQLEARSQPVQASPMPDYLRVHREHIRRKVRIPGCNLCDLLESSGDRSFRLSFLPEGVT